MARSRLQKVMSVKTEAAVSQPAKILAIEIAIYPTNFAPSGLLDKANRALRTARRLLIDYVELHA